MPRKVPRHTPNEEAPGAAYADGVGLEHRLAFGHGFRAARLKAGLTQGEITARTGIKQAHVSEIEAGKRNPHLSTMVTLAMSIDQDLGSLLKVPAKRGKTASPSKS